MAPTPTVDLACQGTPLHLLPRASERLGLEIWIKRDDRTGLGLSGNKVRKLEYLLGEAEAQGADVLLTCGGLQSNHCRSTAVAARQRGLDVGLLLRGEPPLRREAGELRGDLGGNLLLDALLGARVRWVDRPGWADRAEHLARWADALRAAGHRPYVIPEGGSNATGSLGFVRAARELAVQAAAQGVAFDQLLVATGSGGTLAGLAAGQLPLELLGVAVCDDRPYFVDVVEGIGAELSARHGLTLPPVGRGWEVVEGFKGEGYGLATPAELRQQARLAREEGVFLDPVYTGKAWLGLERLAQTGRLGDRVCFWHTGGLYGLMGRGAEVVAALGEDLGDYAAQEPPKVVST